MKHSSDASERYSAHIQFSDFDGTENAIPFVSLCLIPKIGEFLNVIHEQMVYFLEVERVTHIVDLDHGELPDHGVTIACLLRSSTPRVRAEPRQ